MIHNGTKVTARLPCRFGYNPKPAVVISRAKNKKYVILLDEPVYVPVLDREVDVIAIDRMKLRRV
jgi:hypothetical protein